MKQEIFIPLYYDKLFTTIFGNEKNIDILEILLEDTLELERNALKGKVALKNRDLPTINKRHAKKQVDIIAEVEGTLINIELNNNLSEGIIKRNSVYLGAVHGTQLKKIRNSYDQVKSSTQINFNTKKANERYTVEPYYLVNYKNIEYKIDIIKYISIIMVDLKMGKKYNRDRIDKWCTLILSSTYKELEEKIEGIEMKEEEKERIKEEVKAFNEDEEEIALYSDYTREELERNTLINEGIAAGIEEGYVKGKEENMEQIAKNMLSKGYDLEEISAIT